MPTGSSISGHFGNTENSPGIAGRNHRVLMPEYGGTRQWFVVQGDAHSATGAGTLLVDSHGVDRVDSEGSRVRRSNRRGRVRRGSVATGQTGFAKP